MRIAAFRPEWADQVADLIVSIQRDEFGLPITLAEQPDLQDVPGHYQTGAGGFWVALDGDRVVGTVGLADIGGGLGALRKMFVAAGCRGGRVAGDLLDALLAHARARKLAAVYLGTTPRFLAAHRFYEKRGFTLIQPAQLPPSFPRMSVDTRFYRLAL